MKRHTRTSRGLQELKGTVQLISFTSTAGTFIWFIPMLITDVADSYGRARVKIEAPGGAGESLDGKDQGWIDAGRVIIQKEEN